MLILPLGKNHPCSGFTLVEMMIVVAILGVLAAIAVPAYNGYVDKSRSQEAKTKLTMMYQVEKTYYSEQNTYTSCLRSIGYAPELGPRSYFSAGMLTGNAAFQNCGPSHAAPGSGITCTAITYNEDGTAGTFCSVGVGEQCFEANASARGGSPVTCVSVGGSVTWGTFNFSAHGYLKNDNPIYYIDENKLLRRN